MRDSPTDIDDTDPARLRVVVGDRLKALRESRGLSASELARRVGVGRQTVSQWEQGRICPSVDSLQKISRVVKLKMTSLCDRLFADL